MGLAIELISDASDSGLGQGKPKQVGRRSKQASNLPGMDNLAETIETGLLGCRISCFQHADHQ